MVPPNLPGDKEIRVTILLLLAPKLAYRLDIVALQKDARTSWHGHPGHGPRCVGGRLAVPFFRRAAGRKGRASPTPTSEPAHVTQGPIKVGWVGRDPSPTALRWVRGLFADDAFLALELRGTPDFDGAPRGTGRDYRQPFYND